LKGGYRRLLIECIKARERGRKFVRGGGKRGFYRQNGFRTEEIKEGDIRNITRRNEKDRMEQLLGLKIRRSKYNDRYKNSIPIV